MPRSISTEPAPSRKVLVLAGTLWCASASACSAPLEAAPELCGHATGDTDRTEQAIYGGSAASAYLGIGAEQQRAIVRVHALVREQTLDCTGVFVSARDVLTARHCAGPDSDSTYVFATPFPDASIVAYRVRAIERHPVLDAALLTVERTSGPELGAMVPSLGMDVGELWLGRRATAAGYGIDEHDAFDGLLFATQRVVEVTPDFVAVAGDGSSGACVGDSGGPLLARSNAGEISLLGILSTGSASCRGKDSFVRIDRLVPWLTERTERAPAPKPSCGELSFEGRCFDGRAVWCDGGALVSDPCSASSPCGWSQDVGAYRCVDPELHCAGADRFGACSNGHVRRCGRDVNEDFDCGACERCGFDSLTGLARCVPAGAG